MATKISISPGNTKLGGIPSVSLPPERTCVGKPCSRLCYARRNAAYRPNLRAAWERNWKVLQEGTYFTQLYEYLSNNHPKYFRWHVGGDIPSQEYLNDIIHIADDFPKTKFMAFTKEYNLNFAPVLAQDNLTVIISMWPGQAEPKGPIINKLPKAWMYDKLDVDTRIPWKGALMCKNNCGECNKTEGPNSCWSLSERDVPHVVFHKH